MRGMHRLKRALCALAICLGTALSLVVPGTTARAAENSWRYWDGEPITAMGTARALGEATALAESSHWDRYGDRWQTTYNGRWTTVDGTTAFGVDVSSWNGSIDWAAAKRDGVGFAIIRCATNVDNRRNDDTRFAANVRGCIENGIPFGVYLYSYAGSVEAANSEADHALRMLREAGVEPGDLTYPVYYDLEESRYADVRYRQLLASMADTFCSRMESAGYSAGVYANQWWWETFLTDPVFDRWERWVANWGRAGEQVTLPYGKPYAIWQFMATAWVDGIGVCDVDFDYVSRASNNPEIPEADRVPGNVYRMYDRWTGEHLLTADLDEALALWGRSWRYEGVAWRQSADSETPIYRLFNPYTGEHLYTASEAEYEGLCDAGWTGEGEKLRGADEAGLPVWRVSNPWMDGPSAHLYTTDANERAALLGAGYLDEGVAWYGQR